MTRAYSKDSVNYYSDWGKSERCVRCSHFVEPSSCEKVYGVIDPKGHCDLFTGAYVTAGEHSDDPIDEWQYYGGDKGPPSINYELPPDRKDQPINTSDQEREDDTRVWASEDSYFDDHYKDWPGQLDDLIEYILTSARQEWNDKGLSFEEISEKGSTFADELMQADKAKIIEIANRYHKRSLKDKKAQMYEEAPSGIYVPWGTTKRREKEEGRERKKEEEIQRQETEEQALLQFEEDKKLLDKQIQVLDDEGQVEYIGTLNDMDREWYFVVNVNKGTKRYFKRDFNTIKLAGWLRKR